jgi:DNA-binding transcriptional MocR family regulator
MNASRWPPLGGKGTVSWQTAAGGQLPAADRLRVSVDNGFVSSLPAGSRLPTHRTLAADERLSLATATRVYRELEEREVAHEGAAAGFAANQPHLFQFTVDAGGGGQREAFIGDSPYPCRR